MNHGEIEQLRQQLIRLRSELQALEDVSVEACEPVKLDQASVGRLSRMDAMQAQETALETARRRQHQLSKIAGALNRIESGEYRNCIVCGEVIDDRRLSIDPTHTRCMGCVEN